MVRLPGVQLANARSAGQARAIGSVVIPPPSAETWGFLNMDRRPWPLGVPCKPLKNFHILVLVRPVPAPKTWVDCGFWASVLRRPLSRQ